MPDSINESSVRPNGTPVMTGLRSSFPIPQSSNIMVCRPPKAPHVWLVDPKMRKLFVFPTTFMLWVSFSSSLQVAKQNSTKMIFPGGSCHRKRWLLLLFPSCRQIQIFPLRPPNPNLPAEAPRVSRKYKISGFEQISNKSKKSLSKAITRNSSFSVARECKDPPGRGRSPPPGGSSAFFKQHSRNSNFE